MTYAVQYHDADGVSQQEEVTSQEAAIALVERLRNEEGPTDLRVFREVPIEVRTYYKVVSLDGATTQVPAATATVATAAAVADVAAADVAAADGVSEVVDEAVDGALDAGSDLGADAAWPDPVALPGAPSGLAVLDPPSGAVVMAPPPAAHADPVDLDAERDAAAHEPRRQRFGRG